MTSQKPKPRRTGHRTHSTIEQRGLDKRVADLLAARPKKTYAEIIEIIWSEKRERVTKSALSRFYRSWSQSQVDLALAGAEAHALGEVLKTQPTEKLADATLAVTIAKLMQRVLKADADLDGAKIIDVLRLAITGCRTDHQRRNAQSMIASRAAFTARVTQTAAMIGGELRAASSTGKTISPETIKKIEREVLGLAGDGDEMSQAQTPVPA